MKKYKIFIICLVFSFVLSGCSIIEGTSSKDTVHSTNYKTQKSDLGYTIDDDTLTYLDTQYNIIEVDGGDKSGIREPLSAVDIGFSDREYWALTNRYGQLVYVLAPTIILQDDGTEPVTDDGRYYHDEANVPGTEHPDLDQGHIIADSLGGVANAYNITPQDSILNRHGDQAYMEKNIRDAGGCSNFVAKIEYIDTTTQTPSMYHYSYTLLGNDIIDSFENQNPENPQEENSSNTIVDIDINNNGIVTVREAIDAGYQMPITKDHWLYPYMIDNDNDGFVGE